MTDKTLVDEYLPTGSSKSQIKPSKSISDVLGRDPLLPGEPSKDYRQGLKDLIEELGAKSILQVYIAEKIYECLWWLRRYEEQKRATIITAMTGLTEKGFSLSMTQGQINFREHLLQNQLNDQIVQVAARAGHSLDSLRQAAISSKRGELFQLDNQIALQTKILAGLQASYEVAYNRKRNVERLDLQNALMRRDMDALEGEILDKPKAKSRQST